MKGFDYFRAFSRNIGILSPVEQSRLREIRVGIPGAGGVGGLHAVTLARLGIGQFALADFDVFEIENMNRQFGARMPTLGHSKVETIRRDILAINPEARIEVFDDGINPENIGRFLQSTEAVIDSLDFFAMDARRMLFREARSARVPVVTAGPLGFSAAMLVFTPEGMSFDEYFDMRQEDTSFEQALKFAVGLAPRGRHFRYINAEHVNLAARRGPSCAIAIDLCAGLAACEVVRLVLHRGDVRGAPHYTQIDPYLRRWVHGYLRGGNRNWLQRLKMTVIKRHIAKEG